MAKASSHILNLCEYIIDLSLETQHNDLKRMVSTKSIEARNPTELYADVLARIDRDQTELQRILQCGDDGDVARFGGTRCIAAKHIAAGDPIAIMPARIVDPKTTDVELSIHDQYIAGFNRDQCKAAIHRACAAKCVNTVHEANCEFTCWFGLIVILTAIKPIPRGTELHIYMK